MDNEPRHDPEVIRQEMCATRTRLTERLEALERQMLGDVHAVTDAVNETVANVKGAVHDTVGTVCGAASSLRQSLGETVAGVKETLDVERHVAQHPWLMVGGAVAAGFVTARLLSRIAPPPPRPGPAVMTFAAPLPAPAPAPPPSPPESAVAPARAPREPGLVASCLQTFQPELHKLKGLAIGTLFGVLKDCLRQSVPETLQPQLAEVVDDVTTKLGGRPLRGHVLDELQATFGR